MKSKILGIVLVLFLALTLVFSTPTQAKKKKIKLNKKKVTLEIGKKVTLKLKNNKKKVKWSSSNKKVATVKKGKVTAKKKGKATITAKVGKKKFRCKVTVVLPKKVLDLVYRVSICENQSYKISDIEKYLEMDDEIATVKKYTSVTNDKIKWTSNSDKIKVKGKTFVTSKPGTFSIIGRAEDGIASKNRIIIKLNVCMKERTKMDATTVKKMNIAQRDVDGWVEITDEEVIRTMCEKMNAAQYQFDLECENRTWSEYEYSMSFYDEKGRYVTSALFGGNNWGNYISKDASAVVAYITSLYRNGEKKYSQNPIC